LGEPFHGRSPGEDGLTAWFEQADLNHDGVLTADEMVLDAKRFFGLLDVNHDGEIDPDEIERYEQVIAPEVRSRFIADDSPPVAAESGSGNRGEGGREGGHGGHGGYGGGRGGGGGGGRRGGGGEDHGGGGSRGGGGGSRGGGGDDEASAGRFGLLQIPEPVASADADFNRGVSLAEFQRAAIQRFALLDVEHSGRLTLPELESIRQAASSAARRAPRQSPPDSDSSPPPDTPQQ
jgi:Ca2+-binding EF-hand superfamily protein